MPKYRVDITANNAESAENVMKVVHTAIDTNPNLDVESVKVKAVETHDKQQQSFNEVGYRREVQS
jgi:translation initiation factor 2 alpha subunit (eIF-2alpha)